MSARPAYFRRKQATFALALGLVLLAAGCEKKPAHAVPVVMAPAIETTPLPPEPANAPATEASAPQPEPQPAPAVAEPQPKPRPHRAAKPKPTPPPQPAAVSTPPEPPKASAPNPTVQITADVPRAAVQSQRQNTENLLRGSEAKLISISRGLSESEQGMMRQARNYIAQSNQAMQAGDMERAYNLAVKANLLATELAK